MNKLPIIGTSAPTTTFCAQRIDGPGGTFLYVDGNQKITAGNGSYEKPLPNAFSLMAEAVFEREFREMFPNGGYHPPEHCPGSTPTCRKSCYVHGLEKHAKDTYVLYRHNSAEIRNILAGFNTSPIEGVSNSLADEWVMIMARWITENAAGGFRWHVSGDVFSGAYARWIADVCRESPTVDHWIYTRSFDDDILEPLAAVSTLHGGNLALNLSCDKDNYTKAVVASQRFTYPEYLRHRLCYLVEKDDPVIPPLPPGSVIFPDYDLRPRSEANAKDHAFWQVLTPAEREMLCVVDAFGKSESVRCGVCTKCII